MEKVRVLLTIISIAIIVGPLSVEVMVYKDNLSELIIPSEVTKLMGLNSEDGALSDLKIEVPQIVSSDFDINARTAELTLNVTNPVNFDLNLKVFTGTVVCTEHNFVLGTVTINDPVEFQGKQSTIFSIVGTWASDALTHIMASHLGENQIGIDLTDIHVEVNGVMISLEQKMHLGDFPLTGE